MQWDWDLYLKSDRFTTTGICTSGNDTEKQNTKHCIHTDLQFLLERALDRTY
jgi:hypothetical protein